MSSDKKSDKKIAEFLQACAATLVDALVHWLQLIARNGRPNAERALTDLAGYQRAFLLIALAATGRPELDRAPVSALAGDVDDLVRDAETALLDDARRRGREAPGPAALANLRSTVRAIRRDLEPWLVSLLGKGALRNPSYKEVVQARRAASTYRPREKFLPSQWPPGLAAEMDAFVSYRTDEYHDGPGLEWRNVAVALVRPVTAGADRKRLNQLVKFTVEVEGLESPTLTDLMDPERYRRLLRWYLGDHTNGGHKHAMFVGVTLLTVGKYLAATRAFGPEFAFAPDSQHPEAPWNRLERLGNEMLERAGKKGQLRRYPKADPAAGLTPRKLIETGERGFTIPPKSRNGAKGRAQMMLVRQRAATALILLACLPVRLRNLVEMQHGLNLIEDRPGEYRLRFEGDQWKVDTVAGETFAYDLPLPPVAARAIERWARVLKAFALEHHGISPSAFRERVPFVFPQYHPKGNPPARGACKAKAMRTAIESLTLEVGGTLVMPHDVRRIVATDAAAGGTLEDAEVSATLLGNTRQTMLDTYFRTDKRKVVERYHARLEAAD